MRARRFSGAFVFLFAPHLCAQLPFYTDDAAVTDPGRWHFEFFDEIDALQHSQYPDLRQNTANFKLNYGLPHHLEVDFDAPHLAIFRAVEGLLPSAYGIGDADMGIKWNFRPHQRGTRSLALSASLYIEFPTEDVSTQLGSGVTDYWLNLIAQEKFGGRTRLTVNTGVLFAGNTSTGVVGIDTTRGQAYTGGISLLRDIRPRLTMGVELYGGIASDPGLARSQLQIMGRGNVSNPTELRYCHWPARGGVRRQSANWGSIRILV